MKKRPAAAMAPGSPPKKLALVDGSDVLRRCSIVGKAVVGATGFPQPVPAMLERSLPDSLGVPKEERHAFQEKVVAMVGEVLGTVETRLQSQIDTAEKRLSEADAEKERLQTAEQVAIEESIKLAQATEACKTALEGKQAELDEANAKCRSKEEEQKAGDDKLHAAEDKKQRLTIACMETLAQLKEGTVPPEQQNSHIATLLELGRQCSLDPSLISTLPSACSKPPHERGSFDAMVLKQVEKEFSKSIEVLTKTIENDAPAKSQREAETAAAVAEAKSVVEVTDAAKAALDKAKAELKKGEAAAKVASKALNQHGPALNKVSVQLERAKAKLEELREGPLATFKGLVEYSLVPAVSEQKEPAEVAEPSVAKEDAKVEDPTDAKTEDPTPAATAASA